jgi:hypothetical protein
LEPNPKVYRDICAIFLLRIELRRSVDPERCNLTFTIFSAAGRLPQTFSKLALVLKFTFPKNQNAPSTLLESVKNAVIASNVHFELSGPKLDSGLRNRGSRTTQVTMPETAVNENGKSMPRENQVRRARQISALQSETETYCMGQFAHP